MSVVVEHLVWSSELMALVTDRLTDNATYLHTIAWALKHFRSWNLACKCSSIQGWCPWFGLLSIQSHVSGVYSECFVYLFGCQYQCSQLTGKTCLRDDRSMLSGTLNPTHSLTPRVFSQLLWVLLCPYHHAAL